MQGSLELTLNKSKVSPGKQIIFGAPAQAFAMAFYRRVDFIIVMDFIVKPANVIPFRAEKEC